MRHGLFPAMTDDDDRWAAVLRRDAQAEGVFYYSVKTTGVYCRPTCASRRPRRENTAFHPTIADAEAGGFRPCRRCRPNEPTLREQHTAAVVRACRLIETAEEMPTLERIAAAAGISRFHFHRIFKEATGVTPKEYAAGRRMIRVRDELSQGKRVTDAIYGAGFNSSGGFYAISTAVLGMKPATFRAGGNEAPIRFAIGACSLGWILVAATERGVCAILLGEEPERLRRELAERFPNARLIDDDRAFEQRVATVVGVVDRPSRGIELPTDVLRNALQQRVWRALRVMIPSSACSTSGPSARRRSISTSRS